MFPTFCVDNFYESPDEIREFALKQEYFSSEDGRWPGKRTKPIKDLNEDLFHLMGQKLFSLFFDFEYSTHEWVLATNFQLIEPLSKDKNSIKNKGWIHYDDDRIFAAIVYLTPNIDPNTGLSIFREKEEYDVVNFSDVKKKFYSGQNDFGYDDALREHSSKYKETIKFDNIYNRLIGFNNSTLHGVNSYYSEVPRLTQVFFVKTLYGNSEAPLIRASRYKI